MLLGALCALGMLLFGMPHALMIGALTAFTALVPIVGAFIGGAIGAFLLLMESPAQALLFLVFIVVLQQLEGNPIYPHVVGSSLQLPSMGAGLTDRGGGVLAASLGTFWRAPRCQRLPAAQKRCEQALPLVFVVQRRGAF